MPVSLSYVFFKKLCINSKHLIHLELQAGVKVLKAAVN